MATPRYIETPASRDLPTMTILADGQEIDATVQVYSATLTRGANRISRCELVFRDGDQSTSDFPLSAEDTFKPGVTITVNAGYHMLEEQIFEGIVVRHSIEFEGLSQSLLVVECMDAAVKMTVGRKNAYFYEKTDSDIISEIAKAYGLDADVDDTDEEHPEMVQYYATDWDFVVARAEVNGMLVFTEDGTLKVKAPDTSAEPKVTLLHGGSMIDFRASMDSRWQYPSVKSYGWDYAGQESVEKEGKVSGFTEAGDLSGDDLSGDMELEFFQLQHPAKRGDKELESWANAALMRSRLAKITGSVRFQGVADVWPGDMIGLDGVGARFNGNVFVAGLRQVVNLDNWETEVDFGLSREWFMTKYDDVVEPMSSGLVPGIHGLQTAVVRNIHEDPDGEYRVQVTLPMISVEEDGVWARVATLDAGDGRGSFFRPEVDDEVVVGFLNGDPRDPVILGMLHSSALPSPLEPEEDNFEKGFFTKSGIKLLFNDDTVTCTIETPNGNKAVLDDDSGSITFEDENGNVIEMTSDGITISSAKDLVLEATGDVTVEGVNIEASASAQFTAEGSAGVEVSSSATAVLKGSLVQIN